jgi:hypothetical protein
LFQAFVSKDSDYCNDLENLLQIVQLWCQLAPVRKEVMKLPLNSSRHPTGLSTMFRYMNAQERRMEIGSTLDPKLWLQ